MFKQLTPNENRISNMNGRLNELNRFLFTLLMTAISLSIMKKETQEYIIKKCYALQHDCGFKKDYVTDLTTMIQNPKPLSEFTYLETVLFHSGYNYMIYYIISKKEFFTVLGCFLYITTVITN